MSHPQVEKPMSDFKESPLHEVDGSIPRSDEEAIPELHAKTILIVAAVALLSFAQVLGLASAGAYSSVVASVIGGADKASWLVACITLPLVILSLPISQAAEYWGRRWFLIVLTALGFVGSMITSRANSIGVALVGQTFIGFATSTTALCFAVASEVIPHRHRMSAQAAVGLGNGFGGMTGLMVGAALITSKGPSGFRILWYINAAFYVLATLVFVVCYRPPPRELQLSLSLRQKLAKLDWIGYALLDIGLVLFCIGLSWAKNPYPWGSAHVLATFIPGAAFLAAFGVFEWRFRTDGVLDHRFFTRGRNFALAVVAICLEGMIFIACNNFFPFQFSVLYDSRTIFIGLGFSVIFLSYNAMAIIAAIYCYRFRQLRIVIIAAFVFFVVFDICMCTTTLGSNQAIWGYPVIAGVGLAWAICALITTAQFNAPPELISQASGLMAASRGLGATIGTAVYTAVFSSKIVALLPSKVAAAALKAGLPASSLPMLIHDLVAGATDSLGEIPGISPAIIGASVTALKTAYLESFRYIWIVSTALAAFGVLVSLFLVDRKDDFNMKIDAPAESDEALYGSRRHAEPGTTQEPGPN